MPFDLSCDVVSLLGQHKGCRKAAKRLQKGCKKAAADVIRHLDVTEMHTSIVHKACCVLGTPVKSLIH